MLILQKKIIKQHTFPQDISEPALKGLKRWHIFCTNHGDQRVFINALVSSFWFIWIPMLWFYGHYEYFYSYSAGIDFIAYRRQVLKSKVYPHAVWKTHSFLLELGLYVFFFFFLQKEIKRVRKRKDIPEEVRMRALADPDRMWALRMKFLERAKRYFGVPYAKRYWKAEGGCRESKIHQITRESVRDADHNPDNQKI